MRRYLKAYDVEVIIKQNFIVCPNIQADGETLRRIDAADQPEMLAS
jgi:hypothetical protein